MGGVGDAAGDGPGRPWERLSVTWSVVLAEQLVRPWRVFQSPACGSGKGRKRLHGFQKRKKGSEDSDGDLSVAVRRRGCALLPPSPALLEAYLAWEE